jgi:hypothetical protein
MRNACVLVAVCVAAQSLAATSVQDFPTHRKANWFEPYIMGVGAGFLWANTSLRHEGKTPLYCPPEKCGVSFDQYMGILSRELTLPEMRAVDPRTPNRIGIAIGIAPYLPLCRNVGTNLRRVNHRIISKD